MDIILKILLVVLALSPFILMAFGIPKVEKRKKCEKNSTKYCPYVVEFGYAGGMRASGHFQCCKVKDQLKALNKWIATSEPNKTYGEFTFSKEIIDQAKEEEKFWDELDSSGPTEPKS